MRAHHECFDGSGSPRGPAGAEIPLEAAVIAVADAWDAMTSDPVVTGSPVLTGSPRLA